MVVQEILSNQKGPAPRDQFCDSSHPISPSFLETYSVRLGGSKDLSYTLKDLPNPPHTKFYLHPAAYMQHLWANWDDEDKHWDPTMGLGDYIIKGTKIAMKHWPSVAEPWRNPLRTQWWKYEILVNESRNFPSIDRFLQAYSDPNGKPRMITEIGKIIVQRNKIADPRRQKSYRKKKVVSSSVERLPLSMTPQCSGTSVPCSSQTASSFTRYCGVLVKNFNFEGVDTSNNDSVRSTAEAFVHKAGCFHSGTGFSASIYGENCLFLMWKHKHDAEAFVNAFNNHPMMYQNLEIAPYFQ
ncbi:hypothetical protein BDP27DRAFT_1425864 [Rhodocollybia butyracea]|uniref:Uncharacterized protein n=1 Tax=Rhodocollybia butyracea TaxID=206335 RepID=A0A9P5PKS9_9AGAR|nr:hypothetical protein BDP27DRAFT_1425864 [Rhodocollybia butyracea]